MNNKLEQIIKQKQKEVDLLKAQLSEKPNHIINTILSGKLRPEPFYSFSKALSKNSLGVIAEIKRKSPSKGSLAEITDPVELAYEYIKGGADALSILTDTEFFGGYLEDLSRIAKYAHQAIPILRKDFIIDEVQIAQSLAAGANAILLIVAVLGNKTKSLLTYAHYLGLEVLVEVHNQKEVDIALESGAEIIGINNRDLTTFEISTENAFTLKKYMPKEVITVAESGITQPTLAQEYYQAGFNGVLIGEALVTSTDPKVFIQACKNG